VMIGCLYLAFTGGLKIKQSDSLEGHWPDEK